MTVRLPADIERLAEAASASEGLTIEEWVAGLIRKEPLLGEEKADALTMSELPALSRYPVGYED